MRGRFPALVGPSSLFWDRGMTITTSKEGRAADYLSQGLIELELMEHKSTFKFLIDHIKVAVPALRVLHAQITNTKMPLDGADKFVRSEN